MRILLAEDDFIARRVLMGYLEAYGRPDIAVNGQEAVQAVQNALEHNAPYDLICLDVRMPRIDGLTALRAIRRAEQARTDLPAAKVLITTGVNDRASIQEALSAACESYLVKPIHRQTLHSELRRLGLPV